jgi:hypothetical protein
VISILDEYAKKKLQPFLVYLNQTPVSELLNDYTYLLVFIGREPDEQIERLEYLESQVTAPGTGISWRQFDTWRAGCTKRAAEDPVAFYDSADSWHDKYFGKKPAPGCMGDVQTQAVQWLVPGLLPLGEVSLLGADGGTGKGIWQAQLIAYVTTGKTSGFFPVPPPKTGNVLVLTGEDDPGKVLKARYIAAGADVSKIFVLSSDEYFDRAGKILTIKDAALAEYAAKFDPALLIIDPLQSFLPADVEMGSRNQMRSAIVPLRGISKRQNCAALISMHSNKKQGVSGRARLADSSDIWDIARSVLMMGRSKNDGKTYLSHEKSSYCAPQQTVLLHIEDTAVEGIPTARAVFDGYTDKKDADFIEEKRFRTAQTKDDTAAAILNTLAECRLGSMASNELRSAVTREIGCSQGTYNRAYGALVKSGEIEKFQLNQKDGIRGWFSRLPLTG